MEKWRTIQEVDKQYVEWQSELDSLGKKYNNEVFFLCQIIFVGTF